jgi:hypothetical protein
MVNVGFPSVFGVCLEGNNEIGVFGVVSRGKRRGRRGSRPLFQGVKKGFRKMYFCFFGFSWWKTEKSTASAIDRSQSARHKLLFSAIN